MKRWPLSLVAVIAIATLSGCGPKEEETVTVPPDANKHMSISGASEGQGKATESAAGQTPSESQ